MLFRSLAVALIGAPGLACAQTQTPSFIAPPLSVPPLVGQPGPSPTPKATTQRDLDFQKAEANFKAKNYPDAYLQLLPLAHAGEPRAQYLLALMSDNGTGPVQIDYNEAARWYRAAADQNFPEAQYALANAYATARGVPLDAKASLEWLMQIGRAHV